MMASEQALRGFPMLVLFHLDLGDLSVGVELFNILLVDTLRIEIQ
jgi:hypothetical protein